MVHFVGAGPGAEDLITIRGMEYLKNADVIIYAGSLVNPKLLNYAKERCSIYNSAYMNLDEVISVIKNAESDGLDVVRLHTGEPSIYGAIREQMDMLDELNIEFDVCPGVSSMFGAAAALKCEFTLPEVSQSVIITRAPGRTAVPEKESLRSMAGHKATMVLFLSSGLADTVKQELMAGGYEAETPVGIVYKASWPEEKVIKTTLDKLPDTMLKEGINKTALIIVGNVLGDTYEKSKLYDATFTTGFRKGSEETEIHGTSGINSYKDSINNTYSFANKKLLMLACSEKSYHLMQQVKSSLLSLADAPSDIICKVKCKAIPDEAEEKSVKEIVADYYDKVDGIIFFAATGIAVRSINEFIGHKSKDPAVLAVDELGRYCISLLSGHMGGANALADFISGLIGAQSVVTTATDSEGKFAVDDFARVNNLVLKDWELAKELSVAVLSGRRVRLISDIPVLGNAPDEVELCQTDNIGDIIKKEFSLDMEASGIDNTKNLCILISDKKVTLPPVCLRLVPRDIIIGIGCKKDTPYEKIKYAVEACCLDNQILTDSISEFASIELKKDEPGIIRYCRELGVPFNTYTAEELNSLDGEFTESEFVARTTGVSNVCETSAMLAASKLMTGELHSSVTDGRNKNCNISKKNVSDNNIPDTFFVCRKTVYDGVTIAIVRMKGSVHF